jgi:hypothetical protein
VVYPVPALAGTRIDRLRLDAGGASPDCLASFSGEDRVPRFRPCTPVQPGPPGVLNSTQNGLSSLRMELP